MSNNPTYKTGIKTLTDVQLRNGLPSYDILFEKIATIRENAKKISSLPIDGSFENLKYDNIFSILGGRGAGKTSILLTIHDKLKTDTSNINIIMPLIMPELIDNGDSFIGWILSAVEKGLQNIENKIKERGYRKGDGSYSEMCDKFHFFERCSFNNGNTLHNTFSELKKSYYAKVYNSRRGEWDINSDMALVSSINDKGFSLTEQFTSFWNQLVATYREYYRTSNDDQRTPLIFFMIDDADLKPQIINELIFSLPKYFSHPNVVVLVSASQKTLNYTVKNFMYQQITNKDFDLMKLMEMEFRYNSEVYIGLDRHPMVRFHELRYGKEYDKIINLTEEVLRKLFPVSNRFYLKKYELPADKCSLKFENSDSEILDISNQFAKELDDFQNEVVSFHLDKLIESGSFDKVQSSLKRKHKYFTLTEKDDMKTAFYLSFLGKYPRDIVSGYHSFHDTLKELIALLRNYYAQNPDRDFDAPVTDEFLKGIRECCINFISSIVVSNRNLKMFSKCSDEFVLERRMHWQLFVNYPKVVTMFNDSNHIVENEANPSPFIEMICLLNFVEQLIVQLIPHRKEHHGYSELQQIIDICNIKIIKKSDDLYKMFKQYEVFSMYKVIPDFNMSDHEHQDILLDVIYNLDLLKENTPNDIMSNNTWYDFVSEVMFNRFSYIEQVQKHKDIIFMLKKRSFVDSIYIKTRDNYLSKAKKYLLYNDFLNNDMFPNFKEAKDAINNTGSKFLSIQKIIDDLSLKFDDVQEGIIQIESFANEIDSTVGLSPAREIFNKIITLISKNNGTINLSYLTSCMDILHTYSPEYLIRFTYSSWFRRLNNFLINSLTIVPDENYKKYRYLCEEINRCAETYVMAIYFLYFDNKQFNSPIKSVEKMGRYYQKLTDDQYIKQQINNLQEKEWDKLTEEE